jgi:transcriptional regulator with XRE-family HTH domain
MFYSVCKSPITQGFPDHLLMATRPANQITQERIAKNLRGLLDMREWSEHDLAKASGVSQKTINNVLQRRTYCGIGTTEQLAKAFGLEGWVLMLPKLPKQLQTIPTLAQLVRNWISASESGQGHIAHVAEQEAKYNKDG